MALKYLLPCVKVLFYRFTNEWLSLTASHWPKYRSNLQLGLFCPWRWAFLSWNKLSQKKHFLSALWRQSLSKPLIATFFFVISEKANQMDCWFCVFFTNLWLIFTIHHWVAFGELIEHISASTKVATPAKMWRFFPLLRDIQLSPCDWEKQSSAPTGFHYTVASRAARDSRAVSNYSKKISVEAAMRGQLLMSWTTVETSCQIFTLTGAQKDETVWLCGTIPKSSPPHDTFADLGVKKGTFILSK